MIIQQLSIFIENRSGRLSEVTSILYKNRINISALSLADTSEFGILRMVVSEPQKALEALKAANFSVSLTDVVCVSTPNEPGSLHRILEILSSEKLSIEYMYAFSLNEKALAVIRTENVQRCTDILLHHKVELLDASSLYSI